MLCVGLGAVATTFIAGVENVRRGGAKADRLAHPDRRPSASASGPRDGRPLIRDFVPLADLDDLVFGAWDPIPDNAYDAALKAGVLDKHEHIEPIADFLKGIKPMPAVFDQHYVKRLDRHQRQDRQDQAGAGRGAARGHPRLQGRGTGATGW